MADGPYAGKSPQPGISTLLHIEMMNSSNTDPYFAGEKNKATNGVETTATGQPLTHYHSLVHSLLSWERPRATALSFATVVSVIIAARYLPLLRWAFKFLYVSLGFTVIIEVGSKLVLSRGIASSSRPRKYYTIPKDTVESVLEDLEQLVDFFLIEFQRILFAENLTHTLFAFTAALSAYWLVRFLPLWGLALIAVTIAYLGPLIYINNKELIDSQIHQIQDVVNTQATQVKEMAEQQTAQATDIVKHYVEDYRHKAGEYMGSVRGSPAPSSPTTEKAVPIKQEPVEEEEQVTLQHEDFPVMPIVEPEAKVEEELEQEKTKLKPEPLLA
ncbi:hypothetical protein AJ80_02395 [Polytolypa hystricis UAMH7299]|uniref:Reticulon-like protein n=1 Tax=Polytolypa hystricis (strain UAMH7299) TaxID=1447883 RepID=A0A2B7YHP7_POLH7|nr:hypothetical protein AJ80_02395 [Polytolypa hystricis UAMH7299]